MSGCNGLRHCLQANNKEKVIPVLNYYDNVRAAQGMMAVAIPSVGKHLNDLVHGPWSDADYQGHEQHSSQE